MPYVESSIIINGDPDEIYELAKDMESYPQFMKDVVSVDVIKRENNQTITAWVTDIDGRKLAWKERDTFNQQKKKIHYEQIEGDLKKFTGEWRFVKEAKKTKVTLTVDFEFGIPMLAPILNPILKKKVEANSKSMLEAMKDKMEKGEIAVS
ncbi:MULTISPECIES: type II toxin-antitoxin system RatA family toxin [unclassified Candidatus Frackibacter]|uniref:type II toxin-antitoxin system RatA family toxin n=1 Tax=unclassified Candidatus Frackibacter TaxID=2648818 RepID=UPI00087EEE4F|nr:MULTISPECIES: aromatase/cyclase [unclassified Candidatus Frackibacter]SDC61928.1 Ribosome association toxin PasT (RatA) of the RatAB toxin-antitoxin module [Candidatus Frackibacter sp. WG11]SEM75708.1 Ribosome association toxin PasT (RatA) of the RatAB toxin-antitoxin module [Candidatus Frackibacter sp. WG12]SFL86607.1 Ribosome association toxin PasT (RatA) of the RatAB toxin-antitoxin module [Candidatus Frackibacter sp. WG13]